MVLAPWSQLDAEAVLSLMAQAYLEQLDRHRSRHPAPHIVTNGRGIEIQSDPPPPPSPNLPATGVWFAF